MADVLKRLENYIKINKLAEKGDKILLSLSAGKDSIFLLEQFNKLKEIICFDIGVFHLNHQMRGEDSDLDEKFIENAAKNKNIEFFSSKYDFIKNKGKGSFEERARIVRYRMLDDISKKHGYNKIATAHSLSDNIETVLMRVFTGTGIFGLKGMIPRSGINIKPLLFLKSDEIINFLRAEKISWREDLSNSDTLYLRNFIRKDVIPLIETKIPQAGESISRLSKISSEYYSILEKYFFKSIKKDYKNKEDMLIFKTEGFSPGEIKASIDYFSRMFFNKYLNESILEECARKYLSDRKNIDLYSCGDFLISKINCKSCIEIKITTKPEKNILDWNYAINNSDIAKGIDVHLRESGLLLHLYLTDFKDFDQNRNNKDYLFVTIPDKQIQIYLRNRRNGDYIELKFGRKKIKDLLIEKKLDNKSKNYVPLLVAGEDIMAVMPGFLNNIINNRVSEKFIVKPDSKQILAIKFAENK